MQAKTDIILDSAMTVLQKHLTIEMDFKLNHHCNVRLQFKTQTSDCLFHCLSPCPFVRCVCQSRPSYEWTKRDASHKFKGLIKIRDKPINTRNSVS